MRSISLIIGIPLIAGIMSSIMLVFVVKESTKQDIIHQCLTTHEFTVEGATFICTPKQGD